MSKRDFWSLVILIIGGLVYSVASFAYIHSNFPTQNVMELMIDRLDRIENKLDRMGERNGYER